MLSKVKVVIRLKFDIESLNLLRALCKIRIWKAREQGSQRVQTSTHLRLDET